MATTLAPTLARTNSRTTAIGVAILATVLVAGAMMGPNLVAGGSAMSMNMPMTHYMELLSVAQPRNLLLFMGVPVVLAETLAITELALLLRPSGPAWVRSLNRYAGLLAGPAMLAIFVHLIINAVVPLTVYGGWRGPIDAFAVLFYLAGVVPLVGITLLEIGILGRTDRGAIALHATLIAVFLIVAHVAMILGMMDPALGSGTPVHRH